MNEWVSKPIGALLRTHFPGDWGVAPNSHGELVRVFRGADFAESGRLERSGGSPRRVSPTKLTRLELQPGDILLEKSGGSPDQPVGRVSYFEGANSRAIASNFLQTLRPVEEVNSKFLFYLLQYEYARGRVLPYQQQTTGIINFRLKDYLKERVTVPVNRTEQRRIADLLSAVDEQISLIEATSEKESMRALALMQAVLPDGFAVANPPKSRLADALLGIEAGKSFMCSDTPAPEGAWGVLKVSAVRPEGFVSSENKQVEDLALVNPRYEVADGDLLMTRANTPELVGAATYVVAPQRRLLLCDKTLRLQPKPEVLPQYLWLWLQTPVARRHVEAHATGTSAGMKNISQAAIRSLPLTIPSPDEQTALVRPIVALYEHIQCLRTSSLKLRRLKSGLSARLLMLGGGQEK